MTLLPIVVRELRVAARHPKTYWIRVVVAGALLALGAWMILESRMFGAGIAREMFDVLSWITWAGCALAGPVITADCLSREKRENTLGLLFLTDLKGFDVVLGKLLSSSLGAFLGVASLIPILAIPMLMGSVGYAEVGRVSLNLLNTLLFSLSVGLFASALMTDAFRSMSVTFGYVGLFAVIVPIGSELLEHYYKLPGPAEVLRLFSPWYAQSEATRPVWGRFRSHFWPALGCTFTVALMFLAAACYLAPRMWQERPARAREFFLKRWYERGRRWRLGQTPAGGRARTRALERNPFFWLAARTRLGSVGFLLLALGGAIATVWMTWAYLVPTRQFAMDPGEAALLTWLWLVLALHALLLIRIAVVATRRFGEDRQSGALELVLATPLSVRRILIGQWLAVLRQCGGPILVVAFMHGVFLWAVAAEFCLNRNIPFDPVLLARAVLTTRTDFGAETFSEEIIVVVSMVFWALVLIAVNWVALGWAGMWLGLRFRHPRLAPWAALGWVLLPPWPVFGLLMYVFSHVDFLWGPQIGFIRFAFRLLLGLHLAHTGLISLFCWYKLRKQFRELATSRFEPFHWRWPGFLRWRWLLRYALGAAAISFLVSGYYLLERWRGERAWDQVVRQAAASEESLNWTTLLPSLPPQITNVFTESKLWSEFLQRPYMNYGTPAATTAAPGDRLIQTVTVSGTVQSRYSGLSGQGQWQQRRKTDLQQWRRLYTNSTFFPKLDPMPDTASLVISSFSVFDPELRTAELASEHPRVLFDAWRRANPSNFEPLWTVLENLSDLRNLRAQAALTLGRSEEALRDVLLALRTIEVARWEPRFSGQHLRRTILEHCLQTIWEGFVDRRWTREQMVVLQRELSRIDLLKERDLTLRGETLLALEGWDALLNWSAAQSAPNYSSYWPRNDQEWRFMHAVYPRGAALRHKTQLWRFYDEHLQNVGAESFRSSSQLSKIEEESIGGAFLGNRSGGAPFSSFLSSLYRTQITLDLAVTACAIERYHAETGAYPEDLQALVPVSLEKLPLDLADGAPLRYRKTETGRFVLYSVGADGRDQNGSRRWDGDIVWNPEVVEPQPGTRRPAQ